MGKKIVYIVLGALLIFGLIFILWAWFFSAPKAAQINNGQFGTASDTTATFGTSGDTTGNGQTQLGQAGSGQNTSNQTIDLTNTGSNGATTGASTTFGSGLISIASTTNPSGVIWLGGGPGFNATDINSLSSGAGGSAPTITSQTGGSGSGTTLIEALGVTAIAGSISCAIQAGLVSVSAGGTAASGGVAVGSTVAESATGVPVSDLGAHAGLNYISGLITTQNTRNAGKDSISFAGCLTNVIAKAALTQITASVVNWINSGFNGQPSFVSNYQQFFTNVADLSAGQFIQGTGLAFLCSPFKLQIKIAVAKSYANRGSQSCSLTGIIKNVNSFMSGNFNQGGWPGFLSFTTMPTNNPYGAFAFAQVGLVSAQNNALSNAKNNISPTGFLSVSQQKCGLDTTFTNNSNVVTSGQNSQAAKTICAPGCQCKVSTPGSIIEGTLQNSIKSPIDQLGLANDLDQIINALTTQLVTKVLQNGLTSLSQGTTQTPADIAAQSQAVTLLNSMQANTTAAQNVGTIDQSSISDIENTQAQLNSLANCWNAAASSTNNTSATQNAANAATQITQLQTQVNAFNNDITQLNQGIAALNQFQFEVSTAATQTDVANVTASYNAAVASGAFATASDVTTAQQNRTTLQSQLAAINTSTQSGLQQCQAVH